MKKRALDLRWPMAGLNRRVAWCQQPPFTTYDALNVRPRSVEGGRDRGGSRPGFDRSHYDQLGSGAPIRMLATCNMVQQDRHTFWEDSFLGTTLSSGWSAVPTTQAYEIQTFALPSGTIGGTFTLGGQTFNWNDSAATVQAALVGAGYPVTVALTSPGGILTYTVTWTVYGGQTMLSSSGSGLLKSANGVTVTHGHAGTPDISNVWSLSFDVTNSTFTGFIDGDSFTIDDTWDAAAISAMFNGLGGIHVGVTDSLGGTGTSQPFTVTFNADASEHTLTVDGTDGSVVSEITPGSPGSLEVQVVTLTGSATSGSFLLQGQTFQWNNSAANMQTGLNTALAPATSVVVTGSNGGPWTVTFQTTGAQSFLTADGSLLRKAAGSITPTETQHGGISYQTPLVANSVAYDDTGALRGALRAQLTDFDARAVASTGTQAVVTINIPTYVNGGTWALTDSVGGHSSTLAYHETVANVQTAVNLISSGWLVTGAPGSYTLTKQTFALLGSNPFAVDGSSLVIATIADTFQGPNYSSLQITMNGGATWYFGEDTVPPTSPPTDTPWPTGGTYKLRFNNGSNTDVTVTWGTTGASLQSTLNSDLAGSSISIFGTGTAATTHGRGLFEDQFSFRDNNSVWLMTAINGHGLTYGTGAVINMSFADGSTPVSGPPDERRRFEVFIAPDRGTLAGKFFLFLNLDATSPDPTVSGMTIELDLNANAYSGSIKKAVASVITTTNFSSGTIGATMPGWLTADYKDDGSLKIYWRGIQLASITPTGSGGKWGFAVQSTSVGYKAQIERYRVQYCSTSATDFLRPMLIASANGSLYRESLLGEMDSVASSLTLRSDRTIYAADRGQKLYIADYGPIVQGSGGQVGGAGALVNEVVDPSVPDWTATSLVVGNKIVIEAGTTNITNGEYTISAIAVGALTLSTNFAAGSGTFTYRVDRPPKVYDPVANTLNLWTATAGVVPPGCRAICRYLDRIVLANDQDHPNVWYMSAKGNPLDFNYATTLSTGAVAGNTSPAGQMGSPIVSLMPYFDDFLLFGCRDSMYILRGDPASGGKLDLVTDEVGVVDAGAWCLGPLGEIIFLSRDGLYTTDPQCTSCQPQRISRETLPKEMLDLLALGCQVSMAYDIRDRGIHICLSPLEAIGSGVLHWWYDWDNKGLWPFSLAATFDPMCLTFFGSPSAEDSAILMGCRDGYIRRFLNSAENDDGTNFVNYVTLGPIRLGDSFHDGMLDELIGETAENSGDVTWSAYVGETAMAAALNTIAFDIGTWSAGLNPSARPRATGQALSVKISGSAGRRWGLERLTATSAIVGKQRVPY